MSLSHGIDPNVPTVRDLKLLGALPITAPSFLWADAGSTVLATAGTDLACASDTVFYSSIHVRQNMVITGGSYLVGSVGGTDKVVVTLHDSTGAVVANSALAGTTVGTAANLFSVAFTAAYTAVAGLYYLGVTHNGTTAKYRAYVIPGTKAFCGSATQTFGTAAAFTPPGTFTADKGPICGIYGLTAA